MNDPLTNAGISGISSTVCIVFFIVKNIYEYTKFFFSCLCFNAMRCTTPILEYMTAPTRTTPFKFEAENRQ